MKAEVLLQARNLLLARHFGVLGTISVKLEGFPFGSVVPYCLDGKGRPVILISTIAQHTKNISRDKRCSLTVVVENDDVQAKARLCLIGNMEKLPVEAAEVRERYYRYFPQSRKYDQAHDFSFYVLDPISIRYIGGFGAIHWIDPAQFLPSNPYHGKTEQRVVDHMNEDHRHNLVAYLRHFKGIKVDAETEVRMAGVDERGFDVLAGKRKVRFDFGQSIRNVQNIRKVLVAMAQAAR